MVEQWVSDFKDLLFESITKLPDDFSLSFSGGIESSMLLFSMLQLKKLPKELVTFKIKGVDSRDFYFTEKIAKHYQIPLKVAVIDPVISQKELKNEIKEILRVTRLVRNIDTQCCYAFSKMIPLISTDVLVTGFYEDILYESNKKLSIKWGDWKKGVITRKEFDDYYNQSRRYKFLDQNNNGKEHNYSVIRRFLDHHKIELQCPIKTTPIFNLFQTLTFEQTNRNPFTQKMKKKWFITKVLFKKEFDLFQNSNNSNNMQIESGMKEMHREILLANTTFKDTVAIYNQIMREIEQEDFLSIIGE